MKTTMFTLMLLAAACGFGAGQSLQNGTLTIDGVTVTNATDSAFGAAVTNVVLTHGGGVAFTNDFWLTKRFSIVGEGAFDVAAGRTVCAGSAAYLVTGTLGQTLVKRGAGQLRLQGGPGAVPSATRWVVEAGSVYQIGSDFFGNHASTTTNLTIDVREGATYQTDGCHCPIGPLVLTGGAARWTGSSLTAVWGNTAFRGGVVAKAAATASTMVISGNAHLNHVYTNVPFVVERGATLNVRGRLSNGYNKAAVARIPNVLEISGGGHLRLLSQSVYTGGTKISAGTTVTLADGGALGTGPLEIAGEVTLEVLPGVTYDCPKLTGSGRLTKTGAGVLRIAARDAAAEVVERDAGTMGDGHAYRDQTCCLNGGRSALDVAAGETLTITNYVNVSGFGSAETEIVKRGAGTLVLPRGGSAHFARLTVEGGVLVASGESSFGSSSVALNDGATLRFAAGCEQYAGSRRITCSGAVTLDIPKGAYFGAHSNCFFTTGATVTKTGLGDWYLVTPFIHGTQTNLTGTRWIIHEGSFIAWNGDSFHGHASSTPLVMEVHEGASICLGGSCTHTPFSAIVLRGATLYGFAAQYRCDAVALEGGAPWHGFGLNGPITVLPSGDGRVSRLYTRASHLAHGDKTTVFNIESGATLEVDSVLNAGWDAACRARNYSGLTKTGGGTLRLLGQVGTKGTFDIRAGTVELGPKAALSSDLKLNVHPTARLVLNDGAQVAAETAADSALLASAEVWFDASRLTAADGAAVASVPNLGTAGGAFSNGKAVWGYQPEAPTFVANGIGGRGCLGFNGSQGLYTTAHTNRGAQARVFIVSKWTSWANEGGRGLYAGPFSMMARSPKKYTDVGDDNQAQGALTFQNWSGSLNDLQCIINPKTITLQPSGISVGTPYLTRVGIDNEAKSIFCEAWRTDGSCAKTNVNQTALANLDVDAVCIGGRLRLGLPQIFGKGNGSNRMYVGQVGEVLVFARALTEAEESAVATYLKRKWFGAAAGDGATEEALVTVDVAQGATAQMAANLSTQGAGLRARIAKCGAGTLRFGGAIAGEAGLAVNEGGLLLRDGALPAQVDVWLDAANPTGLELDAEGRVASVANKGACGGAFTRSDLRPGTVPHGPTLAANAINGLPALVFDGDSALALRAYTNATSPRSFGVYLAGERTFWEDTPGRGKWAGPIALGNVNSTWSDEGVSGSVHIAEIGLTRAYGDLGNCDTASLTAPAIGEPFLMTLQNTSRGFLFAYETNATDTAKVPRSASDDATIAPLDVNIVHLGTRTALGGGPQWWGKGRSENRCWFGKLGEVIITTKPLSLTQETELYAYLRKKWLGKGGGSATPPAWLAGYPAAPTLGAGVTLAMADGTTLRHEAANAVSLAGVETAGRVAWLRERGDEAAPVTLFEVGEAALGAIDLTVAPACRKGEARVLGYGETFAEPVWRVFRPNGRQRPAATVFDRDNAYWLRDEQGFGVILR